MISFEEALNIVQDSGTAIGTERVHFAAVTGCVLAENIHSDLNMPPFDKSAMDGFACKKSDLNQALKIVETIPAGKIPEKGIGPGECARIMTGAVVPDGADCVIMVEDTKEDGDGNVKYQKETSKANICYLGEDVRKGDMVIETGTLLKPQHIAIMASVGAANPIIYQKPEVAVLVTGDELVEPYQVPSESEIRNSNGHQLMAQLSNLPCTAHYGGIVADDKKITGDAISKALEKHHIVLLTGGVSMGDYDFVPEVIRQIGVDIHFQSIAVQPGKPTLFGSKGKDKFIFGLPGNPVSSFFQFELLVKPLIYKLSGYHLDPIRIQLPMGEPYSRKKSERRSFFPVYIDNGKVFAINYHGSAHINALKDAHGFVSIAPGVTKLKSGDLIDVRLF